MLKLKRLLINLRQHGPWITAAGNIETFREAGRACFNILTNLLGQTIEDLTRKIAAYRESRLAGGHEGLGNVSCMVHTFIGADVETVRAIVKAPFCQYLKTSFDLVKIAPWAFPAFKQPSILSKCAAIIIRS